MGFIFNMLKINSINKALKYDGKYLLHGAKKYSGSFFAKQNSGKQLCLYYEKGLLKTAHSGVDKKTYTYDDYDRLINVKKNDKDVFVKEIKHNIGLEYTRQENINNIIGKTFDASNRLIQYVVSPKLIFGFIKHHENFSVDTRYFLNQANYLGQGRIQLKHLQGDPILNNGVIDKTIIRGNNGGISIISAEGHYYKGSYKTPNGIFGAELNYVVDKNGNPIWTKINDINNKWSYDKKVFYDDFRHKIREIHSESGGKWFIENTFDSKENIVLTRRLSNTGETVQTTKYKYNENNLLEKESVYNKKNQLIEQTVNKYYKNNLLKSSTVTYFDSLGSYKNVYEYDMNNKLLKFSEIYDGLKYETFYDDNDCIIKFIEKDGKNKVKYIKEYINKDFECIKTIVKNGQNQVKYQIEHLKKIKKDIMKNINIFKTPDDKLIGKEFIIHNNKTGQTNYIYTDSQSKRIKYDTLCKLLDDEV